MKTKFFLMIGIFLIGFSVFVMAQTYNPYDGALGTEILEISDSNSMGIEFFNNTYHLWNEKDDYYINATSGIQITNHYQEYWSHNVWCVYVNWGNWRRYCIDEFSWTWFADSDNSTYSNLTGTTSISEGPYSVDLIIEYYLESNVSKIKISPTVLNKKKDFEGYLIWRVEDIQINMTEKNDRVQIDYKYNWLNESLDLSYDNLTQKEFFVWDDREFLSLEWLEENYTLNITNETGQYNAPIELWLGPFDIPKYSSYNTSFYWTDAEVDDISDGTDSTTVSLTVAHTCTGTESDGILIVTVQVTDSSEEDRIIQSVTHNNEALTHLVGADADDGIEQRTEIWFRINPTTGGTPDIVVTASGSCTDLSLGAISLTGVETSDISANTYYFNDTTPADGGGQWTDDANAFDGDIGTFAAIDYDSGGRDSDTLVGSGTNAPTSGDTIISVLARFRGEGDCDFLFCVIKSGGWTLLDERIGSGPSSWGPMWSEWFVLSTPTGGWTWQKVADLTGTYHSHLMGKSGEFVRAYKIEISVVTGLITNTTTGDSTPPTISITTVGDSSYVIDSLAIAEPAGSKIVNATGPAIHKTDVGGDTHASQYVDAGGAGIQTMDYSDVDQDKKWALSAVAIKSLSVVDNPPTYSNIHQNVTNNTNVSVGTVILFGAQWNDDVELYNYTNSSSINASSFTNGTWQSFTAGNWSNFTISYPSSAAGGNYTLKIYANDSSGNGNVTGVWYWENISAIVADATFSVAMPSNYESWTEITGETEETATSVNWISFNFSDIPDTYCEPYETGSSDYKQEGSDKPIFYIDATGNVDINVSLRFSASLPSGITVEGNATCSGTYDSCQDALQNIQTTYIALIDGLSPTDSFGNVSLFANLSAGTPPDPSGITIYIKGSES